jgi:hypothetical protein
MTTSTNNDEFDQFVSPARTAARIIGISKQSIANLICRGYFKTRRLRAEFFFFEPRWQLLLLDPKGAQPRVPH